MKITQGEMNDVNEDHAMRERERERERVTKQINNLTTQQLNNPTNQQLNNSTIQ